ncbi:MAG: RsmB/NOP family class I SAM-dependent RNA methyltransferase [Zoogloeaceae bacterium]|jgi:16S rRNA (cytosine967-C5)-methyltransferase|nr:RsmB/NOP family class I SAM-dependent RNA methyltransferase [Zoogloeaceae bacterium]
MKPALLAHAQNVLAQLLTFEYPADGTLSRYFRAHPNIGHSERGFIAETCFAILRRLRTLRARAGGAEATPRHLLLAALASQGHNLRELEPLLKKGEAAWFAAVKSFSGEQLSPAERLDLPDWLYERLQARFGEELLPLAQSLNQPAPLDLRVNLLKTSRDAVLAALAEDGIAASAGSLSASAIRLAGKPALARHPLFLQGHVEVQDEGSQLLGHMLAPRRGEKVADFCAGAGGKTLLLGMLMHNTGRLYAFDVAAKRLEKLKPRLARSGLSNVHPICLESERDTRLKRLAGKMDRVLVDVPCSGLGTLRRNPDLKWRHSPQSIQELAARQRDILAAAARLTRPGGHLLYATCSLLAEENEAITNAFLAAHPDFTSREERQFFPHTHGTDGFYARLMQRA